MTKGHKALHEWMGKRKLRPSEAAAKIGVSRQTFHKWLKGGNLEQTSALLVQQKTKIPADWFRNQ